MFKIFPSRIFLICLIVFLSGIFFAPILPFDFAIYFWFLITFLSFLIFFYKELFLKVLALVFIAFLLGAGYFHIQKASFEKNNIKSFVNQEISIKGVVVNEPKKSDRYQEITLGYLRVDNKLYKGRVLIFGEKYPTYQIGDNLEVVGELDDPPVFPDFDYRAYLRKDGVTTLMVNPDSLVKISQIDLKRSSELVLKTKAYLLQIKTGFITKLNQITIEPFGAFLAGLLVGAREEIPRTLLDKFNQTGVTHIIAISGFNISIIIAALFNLGKGLSRKLLYPLLFGTVLAFIIIVGGQPSVVRAGIMAGILVLALGFGRKADALIALVLAAVFMALFNPYILRFDTGFQLSFAATLGLIVFSQKFGQIKMIKKIPMIFREALIATLSATILVLPILAFDFGRISLVSPFVNMLILPAVPLAMGLGFVAGILGFLWIGLGQIFGWLVFVFLYYIVWIVEFFSRFSYASLEIKKISWIWIILYYLIIYLLWIIWQRRKVDTRQ